MPVFSSAAEAATALRPAALAVAVAAALGLWTARALAQTPPSAPAVPGEAIGSVLRAEGTVVLRAAGVAPQIAGPDTDLRLGDVIETQARSSAELRYRDGTRVQLGAGSRVAVTDFVLKPEAPQEENFAARLFTGAMRVVTGAIAQRRPASARFATATATVGIRGTDFVMRVCEADCQVADDATVARAGGESVGKVGGAAGGVSAVDALGRWRVLPVSAPLREGDTITTGKTGMTALFLRDDTRVALDPNSTLRVLAYRYDEAKPRIGRIWLALEAGSAQVSTGAVARAAPERFVFEAGGQTVRVRGTRFGARVAAVQEGASGSAKTPSASSSSSSPAGSTATLVSNQAQMRPPTAAVVHVVSGAVLVEENGQVLGGIGPGQMLDARSTDGRNTARTVVAGALDYRAPDPAAVGMQPNSFFGPDATRLAQGPGTAPPGAYVHVRDGAVALAQDGQEVLLRQGETAFAPAMGGPPRIVRNGVRVAAPGVQGLPRGWASATCAPDDVAPVVSSTRLPVFAPSPALLDQAAMQFVGNIAGRLTEQDMAGRAEGEGRGGNRLGTDFGTGRFDSAAEQARGTRPAGRGRLQGPQTLVGGRHRDTFAGNRINNASGQDITLGGQPGRVGNLDNRGRVSSDEDDSVGGGRYIIGVTTEDEDVANETSYRDAVGADGYEATKDMTYGQRQEYWAGERDSQMTGGVDMTPDQAAAERDRQMRGDQRPREDDCASCGGSGVPIYLNGGQFGNEIRGVERAINAVTGAAGGAGDGRTDQQATGGSGGGTMMQRQEQLGVMATTGSAGAMNWDAALSINQLINTGGER